MGVLAYFALVTLGLAGVGSFLARRWEKARLVLCLAQLGVGGWAALWGWCYMMTMAHTATWSR